MSISEIQNTSFAFPVIQHYICYSIKDQAKAIFTATYTHSKNLASFVFLYKGLTSLMHELAGKPEQYHSFLAAFIGGYIVFGKYNKVNEQVRGGFDVIHACDLCTVEDMVCFRSTCTYSPGSCMAWSSWQQRNATFQLPRETHFPGLLLWYGV